MEIGFNPQIAGIYMDLWCLTADPSKIMQKHIAFKPSPSGSPCISLGSPSLWAAATAS